MGKLTKRVVESIKPQAADVFVWDGELRGFGLRVKPSGVRTYLVQYRTAGGQSRRVTIGRQGELTPEQARVTASEMLRSVRHGGDPAVERREARAAPTVADFCDRYREG